MISFLSMKIGSAFHFTMELKSCEGEAVSLPGSDAQASTLIQELVTERGDAPHVLVVDDNDELRTFIKHALELSDYSVLEASDGKSVLALLDKVTTIDLVLCDVVLPGVKGPEVINMVREKFPEIKVIFMSGYIVEGIVNQDVEQIVASGQNFLTKPFPTRKMLEAIQDALED